MPGTMTCTDRDALLAQIRDLRRRIEEAAWRQDEDQAASLAFREELSRASESYAEGLPRLALSRCPFTGSVLSTAIDPWGLDGPWWDAEQPVRPGEETPVSLVVLSGAMRLAEPIESADFLSLPGPTTPCVVPSLLDRRGVVAVLGSLPVGRHTGFPLAYFSDPPNDEPPTVNTWGMRRWRPPWDDLAFDLEIVEDELELDPDLTPWIRRGKLLWIAPGDAGLNLHSTVVDCPFLALEGTATPSRILDGQVVKEVS